MAKKRTLNPDTVEKQRLKKERSITYDTFVERITEKFGVVNKEVIEEIMTLIKEEIYHIVIDENRWFEWEGLVTFSSYRKRTIGWDFALNQQIDYGNLFTLRVQPATSFKKEYAKRNANRKITAKKEALRKRGIKWNGKETTRELKQRGVIDEGRFKVSRTGKVSKEQ